MDDCLKYKNNRLPDHTIDCYASLLKAYFNESEPFLCSELKLSIVAKALNIQAHVLSQVINRAFSMSFFDFVNQYRISRAVAILTEKQGVECTFQSIAFDSGFSNRATFIKAFKKQMKMTPTEYRERMI